MATLSDQANDLYNQCLAITNKPEHGIAKAFFDDELLAQCQEAELCKTKMELMGMITELVSNQLFRTLKTPGKGLSWTLRPREAARQISMLGEEERILYSAIEEAHTTGIWLKKLKQQTRVAPANATKAINKLEKANLVKGIKSIKNPAQRTYMLYHLAPSEDVTGGSFFDAGDLDESLIEELSNLIVFLVRMRSWSEVKVKKPKRERHSSPIVVEQDTEAGAQVDGGKKKRKRNTAEVDEPAPAAKHRSSLYEPETDGQLAYPAGTHEYPTTDKIHNMITTSDAIKAQKAASLTPAEVQALIDVLVWDEKLERVGEGYRTVKGVKHKDVGAAGWQDIEDEVVGNGLTEAPCGRCPVFGLCAVDSPINPGSCTYYGRWLAAEVYWEFGPQRQACLMTN